MLIFTVLIIAFSVQTFAAKGDGFAVFKHNGRQATQQEADAIWEFKESKYQRMSQENAQRMIQVTGAQIIRETPTGFAYECPGNANVIRTPSEVPGFRCPGFESTGNTSPAASRATKGPNQSEKKAVAQPTEKQAKDSKGGAKSKEKGPGPNAMGAPAIDVAGLAGRSRRECPYNNGTAMRQEFGKLQKKCESFKQKIRAACDPNINKQLIQAVEGVRSVMKVLGDTQHKSLNAVCDSYGKKSDNLKQALNDYRQKCLPIKSDCENTCSSATKSANQIGEEVAQNPWCTQMGKAMLTDLQGASKRNRDIIFQCNAYEDPMQNALKDGQALVNSQRGWAKCQQVSQENCELDSKTGRCSNKLSLSHLQSPLGDNQLSEEFSKQAGGIEAANSGVKKDRGEAADAFNMNPSQLSGATGAMGSNHKPSSSTTGKKASMQGFGGRAKRGSASYPSSRGKSSKKYKFQFGKSSDSILGAGKGVKNGKNSKLAAFLPGGSSDPKNRGVSIDGITSALGPSIFEKVTRRYKLYQTKLTP